MRIGENGAEEKSQDSSISTEQLTNERRRAADANQAPQENNNTSSGQSASAAPSEVAPESERKPLSNLTRSSASPLDRNEDMDSVTPEGHSIFPVSSGSSSSSSTAPAEGRTPSGLPIRPASIDPRIVEMRNARLAKFDTGKQGPTTIDSRTLSTASSAAEHSIALVESKESEIIPEQLTVSKKLKDVIATARMTVQAAREAHPREDAFYLIPEFHRLENSSSSSLAEINQRVEDQVATIMDGVRVQIETSFQQAQTEVKNSAAVAAQAVAKLEKITKKYGDISLTSLPPQERKLIEQAITQATTATEAAQRATNNLSVATSPSAYALHLTRAADEAIGRSAEMIKSIQASRMDDPEAMSELEISICIARLLTTTALHAAEDTLVAATVEQ
ncbi:MAG: hypothetical protein NT164_01125 [Verrucomicrobiae bacterium]|nr:hypothetical protein [Verrucomicrobiae bacterium]